jgi:predicted phage gp36 major capsid-like protein
MKGKSRDEIKKAVEAKKAEQKTMVKELEKANKAEIEQFKKDHPKMDKKMGKPEMPKK